MEFLQLVFRLLVITTTSIVATTPLVLSLVVFHSTDGCYFVPLEYLKIVFASVIFLLFFLTSSSLRSWTLLPLIADNFALHTALFWAGPHISSPVYLAHLLWHYESTLIYLVYSFPQMLFNATRFTYTLVSALHDIGGILVKCILYTIEFGNSLLEDFVGRTYEAGNDSAFFTTLSAMCAAISGLLYSLFMALSHMESDPEKSKMYSTMASDLRSVVSIGSVPKACMRLFERIQSMFASEWPTPKNNTTHPTDTSTGFINIPLDGQGISSPFVHEAGGDLSTGTCKHYFTKDNIQKCADMFAQCPKGSVHVVSAATGSGKSTVIPYTLSKNTRKIVYVAIPNIAAAVSARDVIQARYGVKPHLRAESKTEVGDCNIRIYTSRAFVALLIFHPKIMDTIGALVFDEMHVASAENFLFRKLSSMFAQRVPIIWASATYTQSFTLGSELKFTVVEAIDSTVTRENIFSNKCNVRELQPGGVFGRYLVFVASKKETMALSNALQAAKVRSFGVNSDNIATQRVEIKKAMDDVSNTTIVVVATNCMETGVTLPFNYVVDLREKIVPRLVDSPPAITTQRVKVTKGEATQRKGRVGRVGPGKYIAPPTVFTEPEDVVASDLATAYVYARIFDVQPPIADFPEYMTQKLLTDSYIANLFATGLSPLALAGMTTPEGTIFKSYEKFDFGIRSSLATAIFSPYVMPNTHWSKFHEYETGDWEIDYGGKTGVQQGKNVRAPFFDYTKDREWQIKNWQHIFVTHQIHDTEGASYNRPEFLKTTTRDAVLAMRNLVVGRVFQARPQYTGLVDDEDEWRLSDYTTTPHGHALVELAHHGNHLSALYRMAGSVPKHSPIHTRMCVAMREELLFGVWFARTYHHVCELIERLHAGPFPHVEQTCGIELDIYDTDGEDGTYINDVGNVSDGAFYVPVVDECVRVWHSTNDTPTRELVVQFVNDYKHVHIRNLLALEYLEASGLVQAIHDANFGAYMFELGTTYNLGFTHDHVPGQTCRTFQSRGAVSEGVLTDAQLYMDSASKDLISSTEVYETMEGSHVEFEEQRQTIHTCALNVVSCLALYEGVPVLRSHYDGLPCHRVFKEFQDKWANKGITFANLYEMALESTTPVTCTHDAQLKTLMTEDCFATDDDPEGATLALARDIYARCQEDHSGYTYVHYHDYWNTREPKPHGVPFECIPKFHTTHLVVLLCASVLGVFSLLVYAFASSRRRRQSGLHTPVEREHEGRRKRDWYTRDPGEFDLDWRDTAQARFYSRSRANAQDNPATIPLAQAQKMDNMRTYAGTWDDDDDDFWSLTPEGAMCQENGIMNNSYAHTMHISPTMAMKPGRLDTIRFNIPKDQIPYFRRDVPILDSDNIEIKWTVGTKEYNLQSKLLDCIPDERAFESVLPIRSTRASPNTAYESVVGVCVQPNKSPVSWATLTHGFVVVNTHVLDMMATTFWIVGRCGAIEVRKDKSHQYGDISLVLAPNTVPKPALQFRVRQPITGERVVLLRRENKLVVTSSYERSNESVCVPSDANLWAYTISTTSGDCGSPVVATADGALVGIHSMGGTRKDLANFFYPVTSEMVSAIYTKMPQSQRPHQIVMTPLPTSQQMTENAVVAPHVQATHPVVDVQQPTKEHTHFVSNTTMRHEFDFDSHAPKKSKITIDVEAIAFLKNMGVDFPEYKYSHLPSALTKTAYYKDINKYDRPIPLFPEDFVETALRMWRVLYPWNFEELPASTLREVLFDHDWSTSAGPRLLVTKKEALGQLDTRPFEEIVRACEAKFDRPPEDFVPNVWNVALKDELRPADKVIDQKTRTFFSSPVDTLLAMSRSVGPYNHRLQQHLWDGPMTYGIDKFHLGWQKLANFLEAKDHVYFAHDVSRFDSGVALPYFQVILEMRLSSASKRFHRILKNGYSEIMYTYLAIDGAGLVRKSTGNPSGQNSTTPDNSQGMTTAILVALSEVYGVEKALRLLLTRQVRFKVNGDDGVWSVHKDLMADGFQGKMCVALKAMMMNVIMEKPQTTLEKVSYMSHTWVPCQDGNRVVLLPALSEDRVKAIVMYERNSSFESRFQRYVAALVCSYPYPRLYTRMDEHINAFLQDSVRSRPYQQWCSNVGVSLPTRGDVHNLYCDHWEDESVDELERLLSVYNILPSEYQADVNTLEDEVNAIESIFSQVGSANQLVPITGDNTAVQIFGGPQPIQEERLMLQHVSNEVRDLWEGVNAEEPDEVLLDSMASSNEIDTAWYHMKMLFNISTEAQMTRLMRSAVTYWVHNGTSERAPARHKVTMNGITYPLSYLKRFMVPTVRAFWRPQADAVRACIRAHPSFFPHWGQMRGFPLKHRDIAFDFSDYCSELTPEERMVIQSAKDSALTGSVYNPMLADLKAVGRDSGTHISARTGLQFGRREEGQE